MPQNRMQDAAHSPRNFRSARRTSCTTCPAIRRDFVLVTSPHASSDSEGGREFQQHQLLGLESVRHEQQHRFHAQPFGNRVNRRLAPVMNADRKFASELVLLAGQTARFRRAETELPAGKTFVVKADGELRAQPPQHLELFLGRFDELDAVGVGLRGAAAHGTQFHFFAAMPNRATASHFAPATPIVKSTSLHGGNGSKATRPTPPSLMSRVTHCPAKSTPSSSTPRYSTCSRSGGAQAVRRSLVRSAALNHQPRQVAVHQHQGATNDQLHGIIHDRHAVPSRRPGNGKGADADQADLRAPGASECCSTAGRAWR